MISLMGYLDRSGESAFFDTDATNIKLTYQ